jgi:F0F1-type ATP synthase gamma subunit
MIRADRLAAHKVSLMAFGHVARALRALAVHRAQQATARVSEVQDAYTRLERMAARFGIPAAPQGSRPLVFVLGPEHGFTGALASRLLDAVETMASAEVIIIGTRLGREAAIRGLAADIIPLAVHIGAADQTGKRIAERLALEQANRPCLLMTLPHADQAPVLVPLRPLAIEADGRAEPIYQLERLVLVDALRQALERAQINLAVLTAIKSENIARHLRLQAALDGVDDRLAQLDRQLAQERQSALTTELGDLIGGILALA